jgi:branched-chain amino acid transport system permease protein
MIDYLYYLLLGTGAGAIIAALGLGLVITYQGSGVVNFAHGAMATWVVYVYADLRRGSYPLPIPGLPGRYHFGGSMADDVGFRWALTLSLLTAVALGALVYLLVFRPLRKARPWRRSSRAWAW